MPTILDIKKQHEMLHKLLNEPSGLQGTYHCKPTRNEDHT